MAEKSEKRRIFIYVNDKEVENSLQSLTKEARKLRNEFARTSDPLKRQEISKELQKVNDKIKPLRDQVRGLGGTFGKLKSSLQSNVGVMFSWGAGLAAATNIIRGAYKTVTDFDEGVADLAKTTGLAKEEARELAKEIIAIDTRTPVAQLLELGTAAGRLGLKGQDVVDFTEQANKAFVALGDSLEGSAEDIGLTLGKIASNFDLERKYGIGEAINKIGSSLNELGANSKATEGPIIDFTKRLSGVAAQAKISAPDIQALGALFDESGQSIEVASTTFNKLLPAIGKDVSRFAKIAGVDVKEFKKIVEEDAFEALKLIAKGAKSNQKGLIGLTETLENYGIDSARAASIVGILSEKTDRLTELQKISNDAFDEGTSLSKEFALKNETLSAKTEKLSKNYDEMIISMEDGNGIFSQLTSTIVDQVAGYIKLISAMNNMKEGFEGLLEIGELSMVQMGVMNKDRAEATANIARHADALAVLQERVKKGTLSQEDYNLAVKKVADGWTSAKDQINKAKEEIAEPIDIDPGLTKAEKAEIKKAREKAEKKAEKELEEFEKLQVKIEDLQDKALLNSLDKDDAEIEAIKQKYAKLIKEAKGHKDQIILLEELRDSEIAFKRFSSNEKIQEEIDKHNRSHAENEREAKLTQIEDEFNNRLEKVTGQGEVETQLRLQIEEQRKAALNEQKAIFEEEDAERALEARELELENQLVLAEEDFEARKLILEQQRELELDQKNLTKSEIDVINKKYDDIERADIIKMAKNKINIMSKGLDLYSKIVDLNSKKALKKFDADAEAQLNSFTGTEEEKQALRENLQKKREKLEEEAFNKNKKIKLLEAIVNTAAAVAQTLSSVPYPASIPLALLAAAAGAVEIATIKNSSFDKGGFTGPGEGRRDESGFKVAGFVHEGEWVAPQWMVEDPQFADTIKMMEAARQGKSAGLAEGGFASNNDEEINDIAPIDDSEGEEDPLGLATSINQLNRILEAGIRAKLFLDQSDLIKLQEELDEINEIE